MPARYAFPVTLTLENVSGAEQIVSIPRGTIFEAESTHLAFQSAVITRDYTFQLNPKETRTVRLEADCWNRHLAPPHGVPGKATVLKGEIKNTTDVWGVSSNPLGRTVFAPPSQPAEFFPVLANASPRIARRFLVWAIHEAGPSARGEGERLDTISDDPSGPQKAAMCAIAGEPVVCPLVRASGLKKYLIGNGGPSKSHIRALIRFVSNVFALTRHPLARNLYKLALELRRLQYEKRYSVVPERKNELTELVERKFVDLINSLSLLDEVRWDSRARAASA